MFSRLEATFVVFLRRNCSPSPFFSLLGWGSRRTCSVWVGGVFLHPLLLLGTWSPLETRSCFYFLELKAVFPHLLFPLTSHANPIHLHFISSGLRLEWLTIPDWLVSSTDAPSLWLIVVQPLYKADFWISLFDKISALPTLEVIDNFLSLPQRLFKMVSTASNSLFISRLLKACFGSILRSGIFQEVGTGGRPFSEGCHFYSGMYSTLNPIYLRFQTGRFS